MGKGAFLHHQGYPCHLGSGLFLKIENEGCRDVNGGEDRMDATVVEGKGAGAL